MTDTLNRRRWLATSTATLAALTALGGTLASAHAQAQPAAAGNALGAPIPVAMIEGLSGPFANTGEAVIRNLAFAIERINQRGGVRIREGGRDVQRPLALTRYDNKGQTEEALSTLRAAIDDGARIIVQGNSSAVAAALIDAINKHNEREPGKRVVFLNYSAVDPALTNERCSFWHFRFDAHADMRVAALMQVIREDKALRGAYLIGQDYSFGQAVLREARRQLAAQRPDVQVLAEELHPLGRIKDFLPYAAKIKASGAQAVITGNWGNDLTLLIKAAREVGYEGKFYTFYGNALGAPAAIGEAGIGKVVAVAEWLPNAAGAAGAAGVSGAPGAPGLSAAAGAASDAFYQAFRQRFPKPQDDYVHLRMFMMMESLAQAMSRAGSAEAGAIARELEKAQVDLGGQRGTMRVADHQFQQPLMVGVMDRQGAPGVKFDVEGSGYGFRVIRVLAPAEAELPTSCRMPRPV
ncbi:MAG: branched-chain amino acid ABC transporter substrate-binding protein [Ramlibacter sp.]|uniref:branched-chain amino acid ABC transporter substrate-binding protein n=1 Tax=Ramlibacter sp. TaxID=1917967 RepID=UPI002609C0E7|nr:branched-chain amino acid ABC transporter substrate-binding protein [Ramlibacter sp.]MDH4374863.1 branched-chain amino acid ABC transporter substrate-binding protein [Ramlibacter sp.]